LNRLNWHIVLILLAICCIYACTSNESKSIANSYQPLTKLPEQVTFNEHVAPLIHAQCTPCHRDDSAGPFNLISYKDIKKRAKMIRSVTKTRYMPPWPADPTYSSFVGEKVLTDLEIELIDKWVEQGAVEGDANLKPNPPKYPKGSQIGKPDFVIKMDEVYKIAGDNRDDFLMVKVPFELPKDTFIKAIEFVPDNKKLVHHVNGHVIKYAANAKKDVYKGERFIDIESGISDADAFKKLDLLNDDGTYPILKPLVANYLPGVIATVYPEGIGNFKMTKKGTLFINDFHYGPSPIDATDQSHFNIFYAEGPPKRTVMETQLGTHGVSAIVPPLVIPPDTVMLFTTEFLVPRAISLLTINPHMHLLGKSFKAYAFRDNDTIPLINIPQWDFRWQYFYTFKTMQRIPAGYSIKVDAIFDNTTNNPLNPFNPPRTVAERDGSMRTTDEMLQFIMNYALYEDGDERISLDSDFSN